MSTSSDVPEADAERWWELYCNRWVWARRAVASIRGDLPGMEELTDTRDLTHVMVVGDTQSGKTTLLLRLMGADQVRASQVLRGGEETGNAATAAPTRYRWSSDPRLWMLVRGAERSEQLLDAEAIREVLAGYRAADGRLSWTPAERPLEIGIPTDLAVEDVPRDLRVLDLPGLFARQPEEKAAAAAMVDRFSPVMDLIVLVSPVDKVSDAMKDSTIARNPHLRGWAKDPARFRLVLTYGYSNGTTRERHLDPLAAAGAGCPDAAAVLQAIRADLATEVAESLRWMRDAPQADELSQLIFPLEFGLSWRGLCDSSPAVAAVARPVNDVALSLLASTITARSGEDAGHRNIPEIIGRTRRVVQERQADRREEDRCHRAALRAARAEAKRAQARLDVAKEELALARRWCDQLAAAADDLGSRALCPEWGSDPVMNGPSVRGQQLGDCGALYIAGQQLWHRWQRKVSRQVEDSPFPAVAPLSEQGVSDQYRQAVDCCGECTESALRRFFGDHQAPEYCFGRMRSARETVTVWVRRQLVHVARRTVGREQAARIPPAEKVLAAARRAVNSATREADARQEALAAWRAAEEVVEKAEERTMAAAGSVIARLSEENQRYVMQLCRAIVEAPPQDRGYLAVASLQALKELGRVRSGS